MWAAEVILQRNEFGYSEHYREPLLSLGRDEMAQKEGPSHVASEVGGGRSLWGYQGLGFVRTRVFLFCDCPSTCPLPTPIRLCTFSEQEWHLLPLIQNAKMVPGLSEVLSGDLLSNWEILDLAVSRN